MISKIVLLIGLIAMLTSCATQYKKSKELLFFRSAGYSAKWVDGDVYQISFVGTNSRDRQLVDDYAMLAAAETTIKKGFRNFRIIDSHSKDAFKYRDIHGYTYSSANTRVLTIELTLDTDDQEMIVINASQAISFINSRYKLTE